MTGNRNDPSTWSAEALDRLFADDKAAPDCAIEEECEVDTCARYPTREELIAAQRLRDWKVALAELNAPPPPETPKRKRFRAFPSWANSVAFYLAMAFFAAVFGSILVCLFTGGH